MKTQYKVQRCAFKDDQFYGSIHGSHDGDVSICGIDFRFGITNWYIIDNVFEGTITCKKCLKIINEAKKQGI